MQGKEKFRIATELAYVEVISYNKKNLERELQNKGRQYTDNWAWLSGGRKNFNVNFIVNTSDFLYNRGVAGVKL